MTLRYPSADKSETISCLEVHMLQLASSFQLIQDLLFLSSEEVLSEKADEFQFLHPLVVHSALPD